MYLFVLILAFITLFWLNTYERCNEPRVYSNLQIKSCYHRTAFSVKYSTEYFDLISGETGKSGKHDSILKSINEGMNDLYNKNTIGYNCNYRQELYDGYKVRYCYFYPNESKMYKVIVSKPGLLTEGISVSNYVTGESIESAIKDYKEKEGTRLCY
jgi:hypothetical protein